MWRNKAIKQLSCNALHYVASATYNRSARTAALHRLRFGSKPVIASLQPFRSVPYERCSHGRSSEGHSRLLCHICAAVQPMKRNGRYIYSCCTKASRAHVRTAVQPPGRVRIATVSLPLRAHRCVCICACVRVHHSAQCLAWYSDIPLTMRCRRKSFFFEELASA